MSFIELKNCYKTYRNGVTALADVSLNIEKGEFVFLIGASGSGKSTLTKLLYREEKPTYGKVYVGGVNVAKLRNGQVYKLRRRLGIVFQDFKLLPKLTVYENVAYGLETQGLRKRDIKPKVIRALERVGLKEKIRSYPHQLSGGEQQRVCIARAIVNKPKLLICDEPTGNLDPNTSKEIVDVLASINNEMKSTIIMATHDKEIVNRMKKRVVAIENGGIVGDYNQGSYSDAYDKINKKMNEEEELIVKKTEKLIEKKKVKDKQIGEETKSLDLEEIRKKPSRRSKKED